MSTINITANQNSDTAVTLTDAAAGGTKHLIQFFTDGKNVFNLGNGAMVPVDQITITPGVKYEFTITKEQALLLDGAVSSYKHFLADEEPAVLQNEGTITVTVASGGALPTTVSFVNGDRRATKTADYTLTKDDDVIYANPAVSTEIVLTLPNETTMPENVLKLKTSVPAL